MYLITYTDPTDPFVGIPSDPDAVEWHLEPEASAYRVATEQDLRALPGVTLVALYNRAVPKKPVTRFATKVDAARRTWAVLPTVGAITFVKNIPSANALVKSALPTPSDYAKGKRPGVGTRVKELLLQGYQPAKVLDTVRVEFPDAKTTKGNVSWYRWKLKREGYAL